MILLEFAWIIDLGPEGGEAGGRIVAEDTPEQIAAVENSYTGQYRVHQDLHFANTDDDL